MYLCNLRSAITFSEIILIVFLKRIILGKELPFDQQQQQLDRRLQERSHATLQLFSERCFRLFSIFALDIQLHRIPIDSEGPLIEKPREEWRCELIFDAYVFSRRFYICARYLAAESANRFRRSVNWKTEGITEVQIDFRCPFKLNYTILWQLQSQARFVNWKAVGRMKVLIDFRCQFKLNYTILWQLQSKANINATTKKQEI